MRVAATQDGFGIVAFLALSPEIQELANTLPEKLQHLLLGGFKTG